MDEDRISYLKNVLIENEVSVQKAQDALTHHLLQLKQLGASLEDDVCEVLRKVIAQAEAIEELDRITNWTWRR